VTSEHYLGMLGNFCEPELRHRGIDLSLVWFQQDGATSCAARASLNILPRVLPLPLPVSAHMRSLSVRLGSSLSREPARN